jgi:hypothetical protein
MRTEPDFAFRLFGRVLGNFVRRNIPQTKKSALRNVWQQNPPPPILHRWFERRLLDQPADL